MKGTTIILSDVFHGRSTLHIGNQVEKLVIIMVVVEGYDWHTVFNLESERVHRVVNKNQVFERAISENAKVLHKVTLRCLQAVVPVKSELEILMIWVNIVENGVCIGFVRGGKNAHLEEFVGFC